MSKLLGELVRLERKRYYPGLQGWECSNFLMSNIVEIKRALATQKAVDEPRYATRAEMSLVKNQAAEILKESGS